MEDVDDAPGPYMTDMRRRGKLETIRDEGKDAVTVKGYLHNIDIPGIL